MAVIRIGVGACGSSGRSTAGHHAGHIFRFRQGEWEEGAGSMSRAGIHTVEYKAVMQQGDSIAFRWSTDGGEMYYDFHAHDEAFGPEFFTRYDEGEGTERSGTIVAAYDGQHGWFWLNLEAEPTTITLEVSGFYDEVVEIDLGGY